ncbi:hypothetical protein [Variovorax paradoxus]|uniref:NHL domain-containing protein n=1 Tax=Variovorax paradoxus TaxID=34073 RepID=UPI003D657C6A
MPPGDGAPKTVSLDVETSGLTGTLALQLNDVQELVLSKDGKYSFSAPLPLNSSYVLRTLKQPLWQRCDLSSYSGSVQEPTRITVRCVTAMAQVSTFAGSDTQTPGDADGQGTDAEFFSPYGLAIDAGGQLFVSQQDGQSVLRKVTPGGLVSTLADLATTGDVPNGIAVDRIGNLYAASQQAHRIFKLSSDLKTAVLAGSGQRGSADGLGVVASFDEPIGTAIDSSGQIYVTDRMNSLIRRITPDGVVSTLKTDAPLFNPKGIAVDDQDTIYVSDRNRILKITGDGHVMVLAGSTLSGSEDGVGEEATFYEPNSLAVDLDHNVFVTESIGTVRRITPAGKVSTVAGVAAVPGSSNGIGTAALFDGPTGIAVDPAGAVYVADRRNHKIRQLIPIWPK